MSARRPYFNPRQPSGARHPHRGQSHAAAITQRPSVPHSHSSLQASAPPPSQQHNAPMGYVSGQSLQSHPFPSCVTDVLGQIVQFIRAHGVKWTRVKATDLQSRIDVDLFCLGADRKVSRLSEIQRLKLVGILCNFFATDENCKERQLRQLYFDVIFCGREGDSHLHETRIAFLTRFTTMFLQYPVYALFDDIAQWLHRVAASKPYGEGIVVELCDKFIAVPKRYAMHEYLLPLQRESPDFAAIFITHSVVYLMGDNVVKQQDDEGRRALIAVVGEWLSEGWSEFLTVIKANAYLREKFASQTFPLMLRYDCINLHRDDAHDRFHFAVTSLILNWSTTLQKPFSGKSTTTTSSSSTTAAAIAPQFLPCNFLLDVIGNDRHCVVSTLAEERVVDNLRGSIESGALEKDQIRAAKDNHKAYGAKLIEMFNEL